MGGRERGWFFAQQLPEKDKVKAAAAAEAAVAKTGRSPKSQKSLYRGHLSTV
jgi:hypothetical protein